MTQIDPMRFVLSCLFGKSKATLFHDISRRWRGEDPLH